MNTIDLIIFVVYMIAMLGVGIYFMRSNKTSEDYYVGGRGMSSWHVGLSVVATDVGGGFSIGLGGLGFLMGLSGSWMLFTGLLGAWLSGVFLIPKIRALAKTNLLLTFPQIFNHFYNSKVALIAAIISTIGYVGFTSSQLLAGAKLASASFDMLDLSTALIVMGTIAVVYTVMGGLKAVIYTDTIQWIILMAGLIFLGIPMSYFAIGGMDAIQEHVDPSFLSLTNLSWVDGVNWLVTIVPIWFVGMTLYQRIYACKDDKSAKKAWFIAGLFEYPIMAFMGVLLGLFSRVAIETGVIPDVTSIEAFDAEMGLPLLLKNVFPAGLMGLILSAYFSAILSTADSCLMAASGNIVSDLIEPFSKREFTTKKLLRLSQIVTLGVGAVALLLASRLENVLSLMLYSYAFMVSGLFVPVLAALVFKKTSIWGAYVAMIVGGGTTLALMLLQTDLPFGLDPNVFGLGLAMVLYLVVYKFGDVVKE